MEEILMNGRVAAIAHIKGVTFGCFSKYVDIIGANNTIRMIKITLNNKMKHEVEKTIVLLRTLFSLTNFEILTGSAKVAMVIKRE